MTADWAKLPYEVLGEDLQPDRQRGPGGQPGRVRHLVQAARHDRVGVRRTPMSPTSAAAKRRSGETTTCPWCSARCAIEAATCPSCGASLRDAADGDVLGVTQIDPSAVSPGAARSSHGGSTVVAHRRRPGRGGRIGGQGRAAASRGSPPRDAQARARGDRRRARGEGRIRRRRIASCRPRTRRERGRPGRRAGRGCPPPARRSCASRSCGSPTAAGSPGMSRPADAG